jgi:hypothetical protein
MEKLQAAEAELRGRIGTLSGKRDLAQGALDRATEKRQLLLVSGDLSDDAALERHDAEVAATASRMKGLVDAVSALSRQLADIEQKIADERSAVARSEASESLQAQIDAIDRALSPYLAAATDLAFALDALHFHFESTEMARFVRGDASQIEIAAGLALAELRAMVEQIATGSMSIPSAPPPEATVVAESPMATEPTQVIFMIRSAKFSPKRQNAISPAV